MTTQKKRYLLRNQIPPSEFAVRRMPYYPSAWDWLLGYLRFNPGDIRRRSEVIKKRRTEVVRDNEFDFRAALDIREATQSLVASIPPTNDLVAGAAVHRGLAIGEVARHFDSQTVGSITGWVQHHLRSWSSSHSTTYEAGNLGGLGDSTFGGSLGVTVGRSSVNLNIDAITRDDLLSEGFIAVFEERFTGGAPEIIRLVVPPEPVCRDLIIAACEAMGRSFGAGSWRHMELQSTSAALRKAAFTSDISYVSDRLNAVLRMEARERPTMVVVGSEITDHALLGGAVEFSDKPGEWCQLFPLGLVERLREVAAAMPDMNARILLND